MMKAPFRILVLACAIGTLTACGGDDAPSPVPVATSTPTPSPSPSPSSALNTVTFAFGQPVGFTYAVLGYRVAAKAGSFDEDTRDPATIDPTIPFGLTYSGSGNFRLSIGGLGEGPLSSSGGGGISSEDGRTTEFGFNALGGTGGISEALDFEGRPLAATAFGGLSVTARTSLYYADVYPFVYGVPTQPTVVPTSGVAEFRDCCGSTYSAIRIDYATGRMTATRLGEGIAFIDVALDTDRSAFSGRFMSKDGEGTVEGRFTGSDGKELMMRMIVPGKAAYLFAMSKADLPEG